VSFREYRYNDNIVYIIETKVHLIVYKVLMTYTIKDFRQSVLIVLSYCMGCKVFLKTINLFN